MTKPKDGLIVVDWQCGARTRSGGFCKAPKVSGKARCRMHGGASGSGGQPGNTNAWKHGFYSRGAMMERKRLAAEIRLIRRALKEMKAMGRDVPST